MQHNSTHHTWNTKHGEYSQVKSLHKNTAIVVEWIGSVSCALVVRSVETNEKLSCLTLFVMWCCVNLTDSKQVKVKWTINVSDYDESLHRHDKKQKMESRKAASEEMRLQTTAKNRQRGCRRDVRLILICVLVARLRQCLTLSNPVP